MLTDTGIIVIDLQTVLTFDDLVAFQLFSDGKVTDFRLATHAATGDAAPRATDGGWVLVDSAFTEIGPGSYDGDLGAVTDPTHPRVASTSSRYLLVAFQNDASYDDGSYLEVRSLKSATIVARETAQRSTN